MSAIITAFLAKLVLALILSVLVTAGIVFVFARDKAMDFVLGAVRIVFSILASPVLYLRGAVNGVADQRRLASAGDSDRQFLLNRLMTILQALVIVAAVVVIVTGLMSAWDAFVPPKHLRDSVKEARQTLENEKEQLTSATSSVVALDSKWQATQAGEVAKAREPFKAQIATADAAMKRASDLARQWGGSAAGVLLQLQSTAASQPIEQSRDARNVRRSLESIIGQNWYSMNEEERSLLGAWVQRWSEREEARLAVDEITAASVRAQLQPEYRELVERRDDLQQSVTRKEESLATLKDAASFKPGRALFSLLLTGLKLVLAIWLSGLLLESIWMMIHVAGDVRRIRMAAEHEAVVPDARGPADARISIARDPSADVATPATF